MQCNIDARGKRFRFVNGLICLAIGMVLAILALLHVGPFWALMGPGIGAVIGGAFQIFEARASWCVIRAMGFKTRF
jgi:hypothetical protein